MKRTSEVEDIDIGHYEPLMAHNRRTMKICREVRAVCIDVSKELVFEEGDHYDFIHTTPKGSAKIAKFFFDRLDGQIDQPSSDHLIAKLYYTFRE